MSAAACKEVICNSNLRATLRTVQRLADDNDEFTDDQLETMADVMDRANKDILKIALNE